MSRQLIGNFSFYPEGAAKKILGYYNLDKFDRPKRPENDYAGLLILADATEYLAKKGDGGRLFSRESDFNQAVETQKNLVDLYYQYSHAILKKDGPDFSLAKKYFLEFKVNYKKFKENKSTYLDDKECEGKIGLVEKEINKLYLQENLAVLQSQSKGFLSKETQSKLDELKIENFADKEKTAVFLSQVKNELQEKSAPSPVFSAIYNILKFLNVEKSSLFKGFFSPQIANDAAKVIGDNIQEEINSIGFKK